MLQDGNGKWVAKQDRLESMAVNFFTSLFWESITDAPSYPNRDLFPVYPPANMANLSK